MMLGGEIDRDRAVELIQRNTRRFARRQLTWLRKEPGLTWLPVEQTGEVIDQCLRHVEEEP
jgi:tRNA dimethylallyltransferase